MLETKELLEFLTFVCLFVLLVSNFTAEFVLSSTLSQNVPGKETRIGL